MSKIKKGYYRPELQLILCNECDIVCASGEVDWGSKWGNVPDNPFTADSFGA